MGESGTEGFLLRRGELGWEYQSWQRGLLKFEIRDDSHGDEGTRFSSVGHGRKPICGMTTSRLSPSTVALNTR